MHASPIPLVSIIIPCYNQGEFLMEAIESVEQNGYDHFEIIVVNDASTDPYTPEVLEYIRLYKPSISIIEEKENGWVSHTRNRGIRQARWEYIICLDADDALHPGCIATYLQVLQKHSDKGFVYGNYQCFGESDYYMQLENFSQSRLIRWLLPISPASMYRKSHWELLGGYDEDRRLFVEDWEFWLRFSKAWLGGIYHDFTAIDYRLHTVRKYGISRYKEATINSITTTWYSYKKHRDIRIFLHGIHITIDRYMMLLIAWTKNIGAYPYISPIWRKYFLKIPPKK